MKGRFCALSDFCSLHDIVLQLEICVTQRLDNKRINKISTRWMDVCREIWDRTKLRRVVILLWALIAFQTVIVALIKGSISRVVVCSEQATMGSILSEGQSLFIFRVRVCPETSLRLSTYDTGRHRVSLPFPTSRPRHHPQAYPLPFCHFQSKGHCFAIAEFSTLVWN